MSEGVREGGWREEGVEICSRLRAYGWSRLPAINFNLINVA